MKTFNVLSRQQNICSNYLLEASAGTGKTFSIENIVVRLLIDETNPRPIDRMLVVTFTRAATHDLKKRIRDNIEKAMLYLQESQQGVDYLDALIAKGEKATKKAIKQLDHALFCYDQAAIHTIHGFCARMLKDHTFEGDVSLDMQGGEDQLPASELEKLIRDFMRTEVSENNYAAVQLRTVLNYGTDKLVRELSKKTCQPRRIVAPQSFDQLLHKFQQVMTVLKNEGITADGLRADYDLLQSHYTEKNKIDKQMDEKVERLASLFDRTEYDADTFSTLLEDGLPICDFLIEKQLKKRTKLPPREELNHPSMIGLLKKHLLPIVNEGGNKKNIFAAMAHQCQNTIEQHLAQEEIFRPDDLLKAMMQALANPAFVNTIQQQFSVAIIDEFQDTDPIQWTIFQTLFLERNDDGLLYLVGDPKQSIYAFRQADIYTYLSAAEAIGNTASLDTNYRSAPRLIEALNTLFCEENCPGLIALPKRKSALPYHPVHASEKIEEFPFTDGLGALHFFYASDEKSSHNHSAALKTGEEKFFSPYIAEQIQLLHNNDRIAYNRFAILVSDRYQGERIAAFLKQWEIPSVQQRSSTLMDSPVLPALRDILEATMHPKDESAVKRALGGALIGWDADAIRSLDELPSLEWALAQFSHLRQILINDGFSQCYEALLETRWQKDTPLLNSLLQRDEGAALYQDLQQTANLLMELQCKKHPSPENLIKYLDEIKLLAENEDDRTKRINDPNQNAVNILSIHASKGLEYDIVFAPGLIKRKLIDDLLIPVDDEGEQKLAAITDETSEEFLQYCQEIDAEKIRQLYVAMTRAKYRLYVPVYFPKKTNLKYGSASSMDLLLAHLGLPKTDYQGYYDRINDNSIEDYLERAPHTTGTNLNDYNFRLQLQKKEDNTTLLPPKAVVVPVITRLIQSFSSLSQPHAQNSDRTPPRDFHTAEKSAHTLPAGSDTGTMLHAILEELSFNTDDIDAVIASHIKETAYESWKEVIKEMVHAALHAPLDGFCLADIPPEDIVREAEFLYPTHNVNALTQINHQQGYIKGFIDLLFRYEGKYYLLDWKSNWLGNDYTHASLHTAMTENDYLLQAHLYCEALKRFLALVDPKAEIGGAYYLFLRGLVENNGVYRLTYDEVRHARHSTATLS